MTDLSDLSDLSTLYDYRKTGLSIKFQKATAGKEFIVVHVAMKQDKNKVRNLPQSQLLLQKRQLSAADLRYVLTERVCQTFYI